ncbi:internalin A [Algibacter lectus]|uniref:hypothetical protein n=1 Tax=Algibacter lectus TaxID=221126 RepID=UPI0008EAB04E|nr:hypothetical protein [Algibacter lectus]SFB98678.1 internalin A [Algibacter lectus]
MIKFKYNEITDYLLVDPKFISKGIEYANKNKLESIKISPLNAYDIYGFTSSKQLYSFKLDVSSLKQVSSIRRLGLSDHIGLNSEGILGFYAFKDLNSLSFEHPSVKLDFSNFKKLETLYFKYNKGVANLGTLKELKDLLIFSLNVPNCEILSELTALEMLRLTRGNFTTLKGIENLKRVTRIDVAYNSKLTDAKALAVLPSLEKLHIEKCKLLTDFSFLKGNTSIKELFIDSLDSLEFVSTMPNLEKINFWFCKDGNMKPLLESKSLKQINFYPNKKHYTHTIEEIIELTGAQRGRNK